MPPLFPISMTNPCRWTRSRLPLLAGDDLRTADRRRVERHLIGCPGCRARGASFASSLAALHASALVPVASPDAPSLWPSLERQIRRSRHEPVPSFARLGLLAASVLVLGLGTLTVATLSRRPAPAPEPLVVSAPAPRPALPKDSPSSLASSKGATPPATGVDIETGRSATSRNLDPQRSY